MDAPETGRGERAWSLFACAELGRTQTSRGLGWGEATQPQDQGDACVPQKGQKGHGEQGRKRLNAPLC